MHALSLVGLGLLASTIECTGEVPKRFSVPARRQKEGLRRRDGNEATATEHVVVDFAFGGQLIPMSIDSGSSFTLVASTLDINKQEIEVLPALFNPNTSSTYHDENDPSDAYDCSGNSATCVMGVDDVATAGLTATGMSFGVASHVENGVFASGQAGSIGFGRQSGDPTTWMPRDQTFWLNTGANLDLPYLFAIDLYENKNGTFDFGFIDTNRYTGDITYGSMDTSMTNWNFNFTAFNIGTGTSQTVDTFTGIVDTGGPNIGLPSYIVNPYFDSIGGSPSSGNSHTFPCSAYPPPDLTLNLQDGGQLVLNGSFLAYPPDQYSSGETCYGRLDDSEQTAYNLGASFFDQKFVIFDHANARVGFADKRQDGQPQGVQATSTTLSSTGTAMTVASTGSASATQTPSGTGSLTSPTSSPSASTTSTGPTSATTSSGAIQARGVWNPSEMFIFYLLASVLYYI